MRQLDTRTQRLLTIGAYGLLLSIVTLAILTGSLVWLLSGRTDHLAVIGNFLSLGTLALALIAGLVALQAYAAATGLPDLRLRISFPPAPPNVIRFPKPPDFDVEHNIHVTIPTGQTVATIRIRNMSIYPARNPTVIVHLNGSSITNSGDSLHRDGEHWTVVESSWRGIAALRWDGGPAYSIHGSSERPIPQLDLQGLSYGIDKPSFKFELLADGYRREICVPIKYWDSGYTDSGNHGYEEDALTAHEWL
jgi:hypothetical protein